MVSPMPFDISNFTTSNSFVSLAQASNNATQGLLFSGGMIAFFFIILFLAFKYDPYFENAFAIASWSMFSICSFFWLAHLVPTILVLGFLFMSAFSVFYLHASKVSYG